MSTQSAPGTSIFDVVLQTFEIYLGRKTANFIIDWSASNCQAVMLAASGLAVTMPPIGVGFFQIKVIQDNVGGRTLPAFSPVVIWEGGVTPTLSTGAGAINFLNFYSDGANFYGVMDSGASGGSPTFVDVTLRTLTAENIVIDVDSPAIVAGVVAMDLQLGNVFDIALTDDITAMNVSHVAAAGKMNSFQVVFTADGNARAVTFPSGTVWAGGVAPTLTTTNGKRDWLQFETIDGGVTWFGFVLGQDF